MFGLAAAAASGGRFVPDKPSLTHGTATGKFTIQNYDASFTYTLSTGSRSGNTITLATSGTVVCTVTAKSLKGTVNSSAGSAERRDRSGYNVHENRSECGPGPECSCHPGFGAHWDTDPQLGSVNPHCSRDTWYWNSPPSGFTDSYSEWWKTT